MRIFGKVKAATMFSKRKQGQDAKDRRSFGEEGPGTRRSRHVRRSRLALLGGVAGVAMIPATVAFAHTTSAPTVAGTAAATPPLAASAAPTGVTSDSATFNGTVNPQGKSTTYYFQYGATTAYGLQTVPGNAGAGTAAVSVDRHVTGLMPTTTYHYRLVSTSAGGTGHGDDETFTTPAAPIVTSTVSLMGRLGFVSPGQVIGVEVGCFGPSACSGSFNVTVSGQTIGTGKFTESANTGGFQNIKLNSTGQSDMRANGVGHLLVTNVAITTTAGQTISGRLSLADWSWRDLQH
jgi:hypothetical protein